MKKILTTVAAGIVSLSASLAAQQAEGDDVPEEAVVQRLAAPFVAEYGPRCSPVFNGLSGRIEAMAGGSRLEVTHGRTRRAQQLCLLAIGSQPIDVTLPGGCKLLNNALVVLPFLSSSTGYSTWRAMLPLAHYELYVQVGEFTGAGVVETTNGLRIQT